MLLDELNQSQREAVLCCDRPSLVIAGAGSGKTRVITYKIAYLIEQGYEPWSIMALTFTNKAAREMKERIGKLVSEEQARYLWAALSTASSVKYLGMKQIILASHPTLPFMTLLIVKVSSGLLSKICILMKRNISQVQSWHILATLRILSFYLQHIEIPVGY